MTLLSIGQIVKQTGVMVETVRFYEKQELIVGSTAADGRRLPAIPGGDGETGALYPERQERGVHADCCAGRGVDENTLRAAGVGQPLT